MTRRPRISVAQIRYFDKGKRDNVNKIIRYIRLAKKERCDIVCFPEVCVTEKGQLTMDHKFVDAIREECRKESIWCIISDEFRLGKKDYNLSLLIGRDGWIAGHYEKINLYYEEVTAGKRVRVFKTDFADIGIIICWDLAFPRLLSSLKKQGAQIVFCPSMWWYEPTAHPEEHLARETGLLKSLLLARAFENLFYVAVCNPITGSKFQVPYSAIAAPHYIMAEIQRTEGLLTADINLSEIGKFSRLYQMK